MANVRPFIESSFRRVRSNACSKLDSMGSKSRSSTTETFTLKAKLKIQLLRRRFQTKRETPRCIQRSHNLRNKMHEKARLQQIYGKGQVAQIKHRRYFMQKLAAHEQIAGFHEGGTDDKAASVKCARKTLET